MKRIKSLVKERWADEKFPGHDQVELTVDGEFNLEDHFADKLVDLGKAEFVVEEEVEPELPLDTEVKPVRPSFMKRVAK